MQESQLNDIGLVQLDIHKLFDLVMKQNAKIASLEIANRERDRRCAQLDSRFHSEPDVYGISALTIENPPEYVAQPPISANAKAIFNRIGSYRYMHDPTSVWVTCTINMIIAEDESKPYSVNLIKNGIGQTIKEFTMMRIKTLRNQSESPYVSDREVMLIDLTIGMLNQICEKLNELGAI